MNVLITGGAGFIGSHLAEDLIGKGNNVCIMDDLSTGNLRNIEHLMANERLSFVHGSILDRYLTESLIREADVIYHLAAAVGVKYILNSPLRTIQANVHGTEVILELASKWKSKVMIASSSEVYGKNGTVPYCENGDRVMGSTTISRWSYACTKVVDEFMALAYFREQGVPVVVVRLFNICGPRQIGEYGMVIPRFIKNALLGEPLIVYGDGTQSRCFTYVTDAVRAATRLMEIEEAIGEIFNIGDTTEIQIRELAKKIIELSGSDSGIQYVPYEKFYGKDFEDIKRRIPDTSKIQNLIGWEPEVSLDELLQRGIKYERGLIEHPKSESVVKSGVEEVLSQS